MKKLLSPWWALLTLVCLVYVFLQSPVFLESVKLKYFDTLIVNQEPVQNDIVVVEIDDAALQQYGQYPFPRGTYAEILENIAEKGASTIVLNIMMPEPDRFGEDNKLGTAMVLLNNVVVPMRPDFVLTNPPLAPKVNVVGIENVEVLVDYPGMINNIPDVEDNARGSGIVATDPEVDGVVRRIPNVATVQGYDGFLFPSLALEALRIHAGAKSIDIKLSPYGIEMFRMLKDFKTRQFYYIPVDDEGRTWIDWSQKSTRVSVTNLPDLTGKIVIVDVTAAGIANPVATATGGEFPGTVQAAMLGTMINESNIQRPGIFNDYELYAMIAGSLLLILLSRWMLVGLGATVILVGGAVPASMYLFATEKMLLDATGPLIVFVIIALQVYGIKFVREFLEKQAIKKQFAGYCSPTVVRMLQENPALIKEGMKRDISICFSDLRGFTPLGESFGDDVKGLTKLMNGYMDAITQPVLEADGMIIKYIGDASMHVHNAPNDDPKHHHSAVRTGLNMLKAVEKFNEKITQEGRPPIGMGAGINSGLGYLGEMGSSSRHSYDVLGDAVSTAARIESKCKEYGCLLLVGETTYDATKDDFFYLKVDELAVKGKSVGIRIYTVLGDTKQHYNKAKIRHDGMHKLYLDQKFDEAIEECNYLKKQFEGRMSKYYDMWIERCEYMKTQDLPESWDGIFIATTK